LEMLEGVDQEMLAEAISIEPGVTDGPELG
jgi:hypothetical protein